MFEGSQEGPPQSGGENEGVDADVDSQGGEGARNADATPTIGEAAEPDQTTAPAPDDDVGVPPDEKMNRDDSEGGDSEE